MLSCEGTCTAAWLGAGGLSVGSSFTPTSGQQQAENRLGGQEDLVGNPGFGETGFRI